MSISIIQPVTAVSLMGGFDFPQLAYNEATNSTYKIGAALTVSSGTFTEASSGTSGSSATTGVIGFALQAGQNITNPGYPNYGVVYPSGAATSGPASAGTASAVAPLLYVPALPTMVFEGTLCSNGGDHHLVTTDAFALYGLVKDSTSGYWYVDTNSTSSNAAVMVIGVKNPQDMTFSSTTGTLGARVYFVVRETSSQWT